MYLIAVKSHYCVDAGVSEIDKKTVPFPKAESGQLPQFCMYQNGILSHLESRLSPHRPSVRLPRSQDCPRHAGKISMDYRCVLSSSAEWPQSRITSSGLLGDPRPRPDADPQLLVENDGKEQQYYSYSHAQFCRLNLTILQPKSPRPQLFSSCIPSMLNSIF